MAWNGLGRSLLACLALVIATSAVPVVAADLTAPARTDDHCGPDQIHIETCAKQILNAITDLLPSFRLANDHCGPDQIHIETCAKQILNAITDLLPGHHVDLLR